MYLPKTLTICKLSSFESVEFHMKRNNSVLFLEKVELFYSSYYRYLIEQFLS